MIYKSFLNTIVLISFLPIMAYSSLNGEQKQLPIQELTIIDKIKTLKTNKIEVTDDNTRQFLQAYEHINQGNLDKAQDLLKNLKNSQDQAAQYYGEYGVLLIAFETDNMPNMFEQLRHIESLNNKPQWLNKELRNFRIWYHINTAEFSKAQQLLMLIPKYEVTNDPFLASLQASLYFRENKLDEAKEILQTLQLDSESTIACYANVLSATESPEKAVAYLKNKVFNYPDNETLQLLYNQYLGIVSPQEAINNAYQLGLQTNNPFILANSIEILFIDANSTETLKKLNILHDKLRKSSLAKRYIDYYIIQAALPLNNDELNMNLVAASEFNDMNIKVLWHKYYATDEAKQLQILQKIELIDPYNNLILLALADYYHKNLMNAELKKVKTRFEHSKRFKTDYEIELMRSY